MKPTRTGNAPPDPAARIVIAPGVVSELRRAVGLTREQLAVLAGRSVSSIYYAEKGIASRRTLDAIAAALVDHAHNGGAP